MYGILGVEFYYGICKFKLTELDYQFLRGTNLGKL